DLRLFADVQPSVRIDREADDDRVPFGLVFPERGRSREEETGDDHESADALIIHAFETRPRRDRRHVRRRVFFTFHPEARPDLHVLEKRAQRRGRACVAAAASMRMPNVFLVTFARVRDIAPSVMVMRVFMTVLWWSGGRPRPPTPRRKPAPAGGRRSPGPRSLEAPLGPETPQGPRRDSAVP